MTDDDREDGIDRHCPPGYRICIQCFDGETQEQAIRKASLLFGRPPSAFVAVAGHFARDESDQDIDPDSVPTFRPDGWMVFERKE
jgi:hypothetical protein